MSDQFPPALLEEIRARLPVSQIVLRKVDLSPCGRELKGFSPFKVEQTPSFVVNDDKGSTTASPQVSMATSSRS